MLAAALPLPGQAPPESEDDFLELALFSSRFNLAASPSSDDLAESLLSLPLLLPERRLLPPRRREEELGDP